MGIMSRLGAKLAPRKTAKPLPIAEAVAQYKAAQLSNDAQVRRVARDALDHAYGAAALAAGAVA